MKKQLVRAAAASVLGLSLMTGFAAADINTTGGFSSNEVKVITKTKHTVRNNNDVSLTNSNSQTANTGAATTYLNTVAGDAWSGNAANSNSFAVNASVNNNSAAGLGGSGNAVVPTPGSIDTTGPYSENEIKYYTSVKTYVHNDNTLTVTNSNSQTATSGTATVQLNTVGGSAVSGDATNTNSSSVTLNVTN